MKKVLKILKIIFAWLILVLAVWSVLFTIFLINLFDHTDRSLFGYKVFIICSDSMSETDFHTGDLVLSKMVDPKTLQVGDVIFYQAINTEKFGAVVTQKIRELTTDAEGNFGFITYRTSPDTNDDNIVADHLVLGKYQAKFPGMGKLVLFLQNRLWYIVCIFFLLMILILRLFLQYKWNQLAKMEVKHEKQQIKIAEQRRRLEVERIETQRMMMVLLKMKQDLARTPSFIEPAASAEIAHEHIKDDFTGVEI